MNWRRVIPRLGAVAMIGSLGCSAVVRHPARAPMITLKSATSFRLHPRDSAQAGCEVRHAEVQISAVRGDTLFFASATPTKWPYAAPRCGVDGPGFVRVADHPELRSERLGRSSLLGVLSVPVVLLSSLAVLVLLVLAGG